ncbi:TOG array regulator of axonemal microtubules protein 1-like [Clavelina lepadiformis]|uniref:TOG array regulator of axonemal microtubules protein 1-like n=1 Tax=Clavelina lepadiformis TaxID=159417 RepID=UPI004042FF48
MAGKIESYISPLIAFDMKPAQASHYHDKSLTGKGPVKIMEEYLWNQFDEDILLDLLSTEVKRAEGLYYLEQHLRENSVLALKEKHSLFKKFSQALSDSDQKICAQCTKLISKLIPQLGKDLDKHMYQVLSNIIDNIGSQTVSLQKESIQALHVYMKLSIDVDRILHMIAFHGIEHSDHRKRKQIVLSFPTLLFADFKQEDFFDVVRCLMVNLSAEVVDHDVILQTIKKVKEFVGKERFNEYVSRLSAPLRETYIQAQHILHDAKAVSRSSTQSKYSLPDGNHDDIVFSQKTSPLLERFPNDQNITNFSKSGNFDTTGRRRQNNMYTSVSTLPSYGSSSPVLSNQTAMVNDNSNSSEIGFISKSIIARLSSTELPVRLQAVDELKRTLSGMQDFSVLKQNIIPLISLLQPMVDDKNYRVACSALQAFNIILTKIGSSLKNYLKLFIFAVSKKLGHQKDAVRSECMKIILHAMEVVEPQVVLDLFWQKASHKQCKVREDFINLVIAALLKFCLNSDNNVKPLDLEKLCSHVAPLLVDTKQSIRRAVLDCFAVVGHLLGPGPASLRPISNAINEVELQYDSASGVMSAIHARLVRKQLPRLNENMLVEYAIFLPSTAPVTSPQGADLQWILAADNGKHGINTKTLYSVQDNGVKRSLKHSKTSPQVNAETNSQAQPRRYVSAGKQRQFPWSNQDDLANSKHPSSAPVNSTKTQHNMTEKRPPFPIRNTWGPESELSPRYHSRSTKNADGNETIVRPPDNGPSYQELYKRKKEAQSHKSSVSSTLSAGSSRTDSGYKPSFASSGHSGSPTSAPNSNASGPTTLSSSCPSSFFEKNAISRPPFQRGRRTQRADILNSSASSAYESDEPLADSPIIQKPTLARSASKRRELAVRDSLKVDDPVEKVPGKLKNTSASPRFDRLAAAAADISVGQVRPLLKQSNIASAISDKFPGPTFNDIPTANSMSTGGYLPSGMQRNKDGIRNENSFNKGTLYGTSDPLSQHAQVKNDLLTNGNNNSNKPVEVPKHKTHGNAHPIVPSHFSPSRHQKSSTDSNDDIQDQVSAIRRSAQNRRDRMRSQPTGEDSFNMSSPDPTMPSKPLSPLDKTSDSIISVVRSSSQSALSDTVSISSSKTEVPSFKYNPNMGVTFDPKNVDSSVSVVGVGYSSSSTDLKATLPSPISTPSTMSISSPSMTGFSNKYSPSNTVNERHRTHRGMASVSPDSTSTSFNIQGKGVFMAPSTSSLLLADESNESSPVPAKEDHRMRSSTNIGSTKPLDGVCGVAVRQPILTNDSGQFSLKQLSETEVSLAASLRQKQFEKKEVSKFNSLSRKSKLSHDADMEILPQTWKSDKTNDTFNLSADSTFLSRKSVSPKNFISTSHGSSLGREHQMPKTTSPKSGSTVSSLSTASINPLDNPERALAEAITSIETDSEEWEIVTRGLFLIRRLAAHHPTVLTTRFREVIALLSKNVHNLRSQVSRTSVVTLADVYANLKKPTVDGDIETTVRALLTEHGKNNSFIKDEINKALQSIVGSATSSKILNALLNTGFKHINKKVRNTTARFCADLVDKMGPGKSLSGIKDTTDRLLEAIATFITDSSPDVRYYGRYIVNELMVHDDFNHCLDRFLSAKNAHDLKECANTIKQRGLGSISSIGSRKPPGSIRKRNGSASNTVKSVEQFSPSSSSSAHNRRKMAGSKAFNEMEQEEVKQLCNELAKGNLLERKSAVKSLCEKIYSERRFIDDNIVKLMDSFAALLTTSNTKLNGIGLEAFPDIIKELGDSLRDVLPSLVSAVFKLVLNKQHSDLAQKNVDALVRYIDPMLLLQPVANAAQFGTARSKQIAILKLIQLTESISRRKAQTIERHVLPVLWSLMDAPSGLQLRKEMAQLASTLYNVLGTRLLEIAEANRMQGKVKDMLGV